MDGPTFGGSGGSGGSGSGASGCAGAPPGTGGGQAGAAAASGATAAAVGAAAGLAGLPGAAGGAGEAEAAAPAAGVAYGGGGGGGVVGCSWGARGGASAAGDREAAGRWGGRCRGRRGVGRGSTPGDCRCRGRAGSSGRDSAIDSRCSGRGRNGGGKGVPTGCRRQETAARAQTRALMVGGDAVKTQGHAGNGTVQRGPVVGADAVAVGSKSGAREAEAPPAREPGPRVGRVFRRPETQDRMASDGLGELGDDDDNMQGP